MKVRNFEISRQMKGIDYIYIGERTLTVHFYLSTHPSEKLFFFSCVLNPVWGFRHKDTHSSEGKLGPRDPYAAKSPH